MKTNTLAKPRSQAPVFERPSIVEIIGQRTGLRKTGKEYLGLCPFHDDKRPSFSVNEEKGLFHCFSCGSAGDVIDFVRKLHKVSFRQAVALLGMGHAAAVQRPRNDPIKQTAAQTPAWADTQTDRANYLLREIGQRLQLAIDSGWTEEVKISSREWSTLSDLADDLQTVKLIIELYNNRAQVEALLADTDVDVDELESFPPSTKEYRAYLREQLPSRVEP